MRKQLSLLSLLGAGLALSGCAAFGIGGSPGSNLDEFRVARNAPLVIPPDYSLTPPRAGTYLARFEFLHWITGKIQHNGAGVLQTKVVVS